MISPSGGSTYRFVASPLVAKPAEALPVKPTVERTNTDTEAAVGPTTALPIVGPPPTFHITLLEYLNRTILTAETGPSDIAIPPPEMAAPEAGSDVSEAAPA